MRSFQISGKKHLFLTGSRSAGKSTLLAQLSDSLCQPGPPGQDCSLCQPDPPGQDCSLCQPAPCCPPGHPIPGSQLPGITTQAVPQDRVLLKENNTETCAVIGRFLESLRSASSSNRMRPVEDGFLSLGIPALKRACSSSSQWVSIDELGYLETSCGSFQDAVRSLLDQKHVIAVLRSQATPFLTELRSREDAFVYDLDHPVLPIGCVILASGLGRRFGSNKLMADFRGKPLAAHILKAAGEAPFESRLTVTRHKEVADLCASQFVPCLLHDLPQRNDTVRLGLQSLLEHTPQLDGCLFCPADQPLLSAGSLETLLLTFSHFPDRILRLSFNGQPGSPVLFGKRFFPELLNLPSGRGGSFLAQKYPGQVLCIPARDSCELYDVDTSQDLERLLNAVLILG